MRQKYSADTSIGQLQLCIHYHYSSMSYTMTIEKTANLQDNARYDILRHTTYAQQPYNTE